MRLPKLQWSLRTLLLGVTALCALASWIGYRLRVAARELPIVMRIDEAGGHAHYAPFSKAYFPERWIGQWLGNARFGRVDGVSFFGLGGPQFVADCLGDLQSVQSVSLIDIEVREETIDALAPAPRLIGVGIGTRDSGSVSPEALAGLARFEELEELFLFGDEIDDRRLLALQGPRDLRRLRIEFAATTAAGLKCLAQFPQLKFLVIACPNVNESIAELLLPLGELEDLILFGTPVKDEVIPTLVRLPALRGVDLRETMITPDGVLQLADCKNLERLTISATIPPAVRSELQATCPDLEIIVAE